MEKPQQPTSITVKGMISSDVIIRHVSTGYIPGYELQKIADIEAGYLPADAQDRSATTTQRQNEEGAETLEELRRNLPEMVENIVNKYYFMDDIFTLEKYVLEYE